MADNQGPSTSKIHRAKSMKPKPNQEKKIMYVIF